MNLQPVMGVSRNPLLTLDAADLQHVPVGTTVLSHRPPACGPLRCLLNGEPLYPVTRRQFAHHLRLKRAGRDEDARRYLARSMRRAKAWEDTILKPGDILTWHELPQDREETRTILGIVALAASVIYPGSYFAYAALAANVAYNVFVPPKSPQQREQDQAGAVYSTSLGGNEAKLDQPIWRVCGLEKITPPFAAQPYVEYVDDDADGYDSDQIYSVVLAVGTGRNEIKGAFIGKTPVDHYQDILVRQYLPPGTAPTRALLNVVTSAEVTGLEMESNGKYLGGYVACRPQQTCQYVGIDIAASQGLSGALVSWRVEVRSIDDFGRPTAGWTVLASESLTRSTNTPQRWSYKYELSADIRPEIRVVRTDIKDTSPSTRSGLQWIGLRGYRREVPPLNAHTGHYEIVMRASEQLSAQSRSDFQLIVQGYARTWSAGSPGWSCALGDYDNYTATRNPAWYLADLWADPIWGEGLADDQINLQGIADWAATCDTRQDRFDFTFTQSTNAADAGQQIARAGRARWFERFGVRTVSRDELKTLPKTGFSPRNTAPDTMAVNESLPGREAADGVIVEYVSNVTWDILTIECPCPGFSVTDPANPLYNGALPIMSAPVFMRLDGIKGSKQAEREGRYEAAKMAYRTRTVTCKTEMQGVIVSFGDAIKWQPEVAGYGQSGDVAFWNPGTLVMGLTEKPDFSSGDLYLTLMRDDGSLTDAVLVSPGPTEWDVILPAAPDFTMVLDSGIRERPKFFLGGLDNLAVVTSIADGGKSDAEDGEDGAQMYDIAGFVDDERVHTADIALLPGPGEIQDPVSFPDGDNDSGSTIYIVRVLDRTVEAIAIAGVGAPSSTDMVATFTLLGTGAASYANSSGSSSAGGSLANEWMQYGVVEPAIAALYEVRATIVSSSSSGAFAGTDVFTGTVGSWLSLSTTRTWMLTTPAPGAVGEYVATHTLFIEIREVSTGLVQDSASITLRNEFIFTGGA
jgi:hypothetical protein